MEERFFNTSSIKDSVIKIIANEIKKQNDQYHFIHQLVTEEGYAIWDKSFVEKNSKVLNFTGRLSTANRATDGSSQSDYEFDVVVIPLVLDSDNYVNSFLACSIEDSGHIHIELIRGRMYNTYIYRPNDIAMQMILLNNSVFGDTLFEVTDSTLFGIGIAEKAAGKKLLVKLVSNDRLSSNSSTQKNRPDNTDLASSVVPRNCYVTITVDLHDNTISSTGFGTCKPIVISITSGGSTYDPTTNGGTTGSTGGTGTNTTSLPSTGGGGSVGPSWLPPPTADPGTAIKEIPLPPIVPILDLTKIDIADGRTINDIYDGDDNNNTSGGYDITRYSDYDETSQTWPTIPNVIPIADFVGWDRNAHPNWQCMDYAKAQIAKKGYTISNYGVSDQTIQVYTAANGANKTATKNGLGYLLSALQRGIPVIVGIDDKSGSSNPKTDNTTDHFIVIVGAGADTKGNYFTFYDNASGYSSQGANPNNKLYYNLTSGLITGKSQTDYFIQYTSHDYIITQIRKSK